MVVRNSSVCVVGSFSLDSIVVSGRDRPFYNLGGATTFTSLAVKTLGEPVSVVSRVGGDFPEAYLEWLRERGVDVSAVKRYPDELTTSFELCYSDAVFSERTLRLACRGGFIGFDDIPCGLSVKVIHVAPIAGEISYEIMEYLRGCCDFLSFDPQGFLRSFDENGNVVLRLQQRVDKRVLGLVDVCKVSLDELFVLTGLSELAAAVRAVHDVGVETVIVTMGAKGSLLSVKGVCYSVPACQSSIVVDPTGAGDVFIGAFLAEYLKGKSSLWCASMGSAAASMVVEGLGSTFFGESQEILKRAMFLYEKKLSKVYM
ncbi:MAG: PfkB family carbohydrate kinase [Candidatus Bathyarchaeota archaeon]|nr:PfkB family carbohydrate kinase [Candidatus Termiticorpusculum sp.]